MKFNKSYDNLTFKGTKNVMKNEADKANQDRAQETDLKLMIEKYGIVPLNPDVANEPLYLDNRGTELTIGQRNENLRKIKEYFLDLPAKIRKEYNDDYINFTNNYLYSKDRIEKDKLRKFGIIDNDNEIINESEKK